MSEEPSSDSDNGPGRPVPPPRPPPPPPPRTPESRTGLAEEPAEETTNSGPAEEQPVKVPTRTLACLNDGTCNPTVGSCSLLPTHPLGCQGRLKGRQQPHSAQHARQHAATQTFPMPLKQDAVTGEMVAEGAEFPSKLAFHSTLASLQEKIKRRVFVTRSDSTNFTAKCGCTSGCGFGISAGVQGKGSGKWRVSKSSPHSLSCTGLPADAKAHALTSSMVAPVVYDIYRADPKKTSWKMVQTLLGPYLVGHPPPDPPPSHLPYILAQLTTSAARLFERPAHPNSASA